MFAFGAASSSPSPTASTTLHGVAGPGIQNCTISSEGHLAASRGTPLGQGVRYVFYGFDGKRVGEQWEIGPVDQPPGSRLLSAAESIERADIHSMRCSYLSTNHFQRCGPDFVVDEGADIALESIVIERNAISLRLLAFYNNFFSRGVYELQDQLYFIQLDSRAPIEPILTNVKSQDLVFRFPDVKPGRHTLLYGIVNKDYSSHSTGFYKLGRHACFDVPS